MEKQTPDNAEFALAETIAMPMTELSALLQSGSRPGDSHASEIARLFPRLCAVASKARLKSIHSASDPEDIVQSALLSFLCWLDLRSTNQPLGDHELWRLLCTFVKRKAIRHAERDTAEKRGGGHVRGESELGNAEVDFRIDEIAGVPSTAELDAMCEEALSQLQDGLRTIALLRLTGCTADEIAEQMDCSVRTIQRKLELIQSEWKNYFVDSVA